ncbi:melanization protease 1 [Aedes albopictus]|uniref:Peptidase S1 domain-containing protein n=1 Tax=Aedes albopictus TaxID=7160 RepID=A0ABM2A3Q1_AEDAL
MFKRGFTFCVALVGLCLWLEIRADTGGLDAEKLKLLPRYCGFAIYNRVTRGNSTQLFENPWIALLQYAHDDQIEHGCSGALINNRYVLTAAHCLVNRTEFQLLNVRLGEFDKSQYSDCTNVGDDSEKDCAEPADDYDIESIALHPDYDGKTSQNDIGLIRLNRDVTMHDNTSPICLPTESTLRSAAIPKLIARGWGTCGNQTGSSALQASVLTPVDGMECNRAIPGVSVSGDQICATRFTGMDVGGPVAAVMPHSHGAPKFVQLGIASGAMELCERADVPGVYTRVASYMEWILETIRA